MCCFIQRIAVPVSSLSRKIDINRGIWKSIGKATLSIMYHAAPMNAEKCVYVRREHPVQMLCTSLTLT